MFYDKIDKECENSNFLVIYKKFNIFFIYFKSIKKLIMVLNKYNGILIGFDILLFW